MLSFVKTASTLAWAILLFSWPAFASNEVSPYIECAKGLFFSTRDAVFVSKGAMSSEGHYERLDSDWVVLPDRIRKTRDGQKKGFYVFSSEGAYFFSYPKGSVQTDQKGNRSDWVKVDRQGKPSVYARLAHWPGVPRMPYVMIEESKKIPEVMRQRFASSSASPDWDAVTQREIRRVILNELKDEAKSWQDFIKNNPPKNDEYIHNIREHLEARKKATKACQFDDSIIAKEAKLAEAALPEPSQFGVAKDSSGSASVTSPAL